MTHVANPLHRGGFRCCHRYYQLALARDPEFTAARVFLERTLREMECVPFVV